MSSTIISNDPNNSECIIISSSSSNISKKHKHEEISESLQEIIEISVSIKDCGICLHKIRKPFTFSCYHFFCIKCALDFLNSPNNTYRCPLCRDGFDENEKEILLQRINLSYHIQDERKRKKLDIIRRTYDTQIIRLEREEENKIINIKKNTKKNKTAIHREYLEKKEKKKKRKKNY
ncbi:10321_t:CDS:1 [Cetraspora pellucida]|uniref:10321_t:CDS:1 n=1 Tax=Cetraspora pellucida TaxID=1433469 RepID=A0A9N9K4E4_9GLOM|nr:10321_t:CDS:1 [Cetraspora pellucida]